MPCCAEACTHILLQLLLTTICSVRSCPTRVLTSMFACTQAAITHVCMRMQCIHTCIRMHTSNHKCTQYGGCLLMRIYLSQYFMHKVNCKCAGVNAYAGARICASVCMRVCMSANTHGHVHACKQHTCPCACRQFVRVLHVVSVCRRPA